MLVAPANIGGNDLQDHAVLGLLAFRVQQLREWYGFYFDLSLPLEYDASIGCHDLLSLVFLRPTPFALLHGIGPHRVLDLLLHLHLDRVDGEAVRPARGWVVEGERHLVHLESA